jgi:S-adenosylmethionine hydrolase
MTPNGLVTLLSDFGYHDSYVGVMKGVMLGIHPGLQLVDLTHAIPPQDRLAASFQLLSAVPYFPSGTVHLAVVDPGVGTERRAIALQLECGWLVGPDNGLFSGLLDRYPAQRAVVLNCPRWWRTPALSATFQGRDLFAPVAAHLARGVDLAELGSSLDPAALVRLDLPQMERRTLGLEGEIIALDQFGNAVTNLPGQEVQPGSVLEVRGQRLPLGITYAAVPQGDPLALVGSHGFVEIAVNGGSAVAVLGLKRGDRLFLSWADAREC